MNHWTNVSPCLSTIAKLQRLGLVDEKPEEVVVNSLLKNESARRGASLAGGPERSPESAFEREIQVRVVHHDLGILSPHLERQALVHAATGRADETSRLGRSGERDDRNVRMIDHH